MANEKTESLEETKWWVDRGPVKEREKAVGPARGGIIEKWAYELLKGYNQDQAMKNLVDINTKLLKELSVGPGEWGYFSMEVGSYPAEKLAKIRSGLPLPPKARALVVDAGYSARVVITGEPIGERYVDINFTDAPSLDYWVNGELVEERVFPNVTEALKRIGPDLRRYMSSPAG